MNNINNDLNLTSEFIRVTPNDEPIVLNCSTLTSFLWNNFIREASPTVTYLIDRFEIRKLSRFGKELFEVLYRGEVSDSVIKLEDAEMYFRQMQNGEKPEPPAGYKADNAFWIGLFTDVLNSPAWPQIAPRCLGDQFNAGNNAVIILNKLSQVFTQVISDDLDGTQDVLKDLEQKLNDMRQQFVDAMKAGDKKGAAEIKKEGKKLNKQLEEMAQEFRQNIRPSIQQAVSKAEKEAKQLEDAMSYLAGNNDGNGEKEDITAKMDLARKLRNNTYLLEFANRLGALRRMWNQRKRQRNVSSNYAEIVGAKFSNSVLQSFPTELALAASEEGKALFALKYAQNTLLTKDYEAKTKDAGKGPVLMYVDISGSMEGDRSLWSKAITQVVAEETLKQNRSIEIVLFDNRINQRIKIDSNTPDYSKLLEFVMSWTTRGGTSFQNVIYDCVNRRTELDDKSDVLLITDGHSSVTDTAVASLQALKNEKSIEWFAFCIGETSASLERFCDQVTQVNPHDDAASSEIFQKVIL